MRIRRLEVIGFKSFPVATTIEFSSKGITAIVGPNGCGKSNILDALMWVMGATSPKLLRSRTMEDVIFAGSEAFKPLGRAEVRLVIDNTNKLACEPYREIPEIEIRRVFYRDGEGEFWLNGQRCRLRDITEFFLGTGVGTNSYAIIEQGKVDAIIQAKPEERRLLLDESAGISKYKERRELSLRKMEATKQNLSRVEDVLYEVNRQANRLKRQAAKARRFKHLKQQLEIQMVRRARARMQELQKEKKSLESVLATLYHQVGAKEAELNACEARINDAQALMTEREESLRSLSATYSRHREALDGRRRNLFSLREKQGRVEEALKGIRETFERTKQRHDSLMHQIGQLKEDINDLEEALQEKSLRLNELDSDYHSEKKRLNQLETEIENRKHSFYKIVATEVEAKNKVIQLTERIEQGRRGIKKREEDLSEAMTRLQSLEVILSGTREGIEALQTELKEKKREQDGLETALSQAKVHEQQTKKNLGKLEKGLTEDRSNLHSLLEIQRKMEDVSSKGAKTLLGNFFDGEGLKGRLVADTIEVDMKYDRAIEAILREELEYVLVENHEVALKSLAFLKEKGAGRSGLIPADAMEPCLDSTSVEREAYSDLEPLYVHVNTPDDGKRVMSCLLKDVWVVKSYDRAIEIQRSNGFTGTLVTLEGDIFYPNGVIVGGSDEPCARGRVGRNRQISRLEKRIAALEDKRKESLKEVEKAAEAAELLQARFQSVTEGLRQGEMKLLSLQRDAENAAKDRTRTAQKIELLKEELHDMHQEIDLTKNGLIKARRIHEEFQQRQMSLRKKLENLEGEIRILREVVETKGRQVNHLRVEEAEIREKLQGRRQKLEALREDVKNLDAEIVQKRHKEREFTKELKAVSEEIDTLTQAIKDTERHLSTVKKEMEEAELTLRRDRENVRALEGEKGEIFKALQKLKEEANGIKLDISQQELKMDALLNEILMRFNVDLRETGPVKGEKEKEEWSDAKIEELERKLSSIGEINFMAIQEFEELRERVTFLERQKADLQEAIQTLTETIQRINRATSSRFKETYEKVQEYFSELFVKLFDGGRGELRLTDPTNFRETGIEIFAQPPGKRLQAIRLLSGGEKALVAIAFLFAMFMTHPSPFCVLDEVDAPLDEGNIERFNQLVTDLSSLSQFILITHNKQTMACAQTLLGVTMEQPGVSKIISVSLEEVGE